MSIAARLKWYLGQNHIPYDCIEHHHSSTSLESAAEAHIPSHQVAKSVLLEDERGYLNAVLPADRHIELTQIREQLRRNLQLAGEPEIGRIFFDCELGAIPALSVPYGIPCVIDRAMLETDDVYIESGDHENLVHLTAADFARINSKAQTARFSMLD